MLTYIIEDLYHNPVDDEFYHKCKEYYLTEDGSSTFQQVTMEKIKLDQPLKCIKCKREWESHIADFLLLMQGVRAL